MLNEIMKNYSDDALRLDQQKLREAPQCGYILVYFQTGIEFGTYQKVICMKNGEKTWNIKAACLDQEKYKGGAKLLELHLFDRKTEYRAVYTRNGIKSRYLEYVVKEGMSFITNKEEAEGLDTQKEEYQLLYGSSYEYCAERGGIEAVQDGNKKFFYLPDPQGYDLYLKVINYFDYAGDMLVIKNYRLAGVYMRLNSRERKWKYLWA